jgi:hypothetical protein
MRTTLNQRITKFELPERMRGLPISDDGYPVPWFVPWIDGKPEFRGMTSEKMIIAVRHKRCWMCGQPLGKFYTFAIGPMCMVNRNISEPPSHLACIEYAVKACPFLSQPRMRRNEKDMPEVGHIAGIGIMDNPGLTVVWTTLSYKPWKPPGGGVLFEIGDPEHIEYYTEARKATREEVLAVLEERIPILKDRAVKDGPEAVVELDQSYRKALDLINKTSAVVA